MRTRLTIVVITALSVLGTAGPALAAQPGPGDKQCVPGHQGNPHPGFKAGVCDNR